MLTSHPYLLGGFVAVSCAVGFSSYSSATSQNLFQSPWEAQTLAEPMLGQTIHGTVEVSYRGSGRASNEPKSNLASEDKGPLAHRGSGRVLPQFL